MRLLSEADFGERRDGDFGTYFVAQNDTKKPIGDPREFPYLLVFKIRKNLKGSVTRKVFDRETDISDKNNVISFKNDGTEVTAVYTLGNKSDVVKFTKAGVTSVSSVSRDEEVKGSRDDGPARAPRDTGAARTDRDVSVSEEEPGRPRRSTAPADSTSSRDTYADVEGGASSPSPPAPRAPPEGEGAGARDVTPPPAKKEPLDADTQKGGTQRAEGLPDTWKKIITLNDPEGDKTGSEYGDPRYYKLGYPDYVGEQLQYDTYIDPNTIKFRDDIKAENKPSFCFKVATDDYDQSAGKKAGAPDFDTTGLEIWSDGSWSGQLPRLKKGKSRPIEGGDLINLRFTFEELWAELVSMKGKVGLPDRPAPEAKPAAPPADGSGERDASTETKDDTVEGGGIEATLGDRGCCHTPSKLFYKCYSEDYLEKGFPDGLDSGNEAGFYAPKGEYGGSVNRFSRGIEKSGSVWKHFIYTMQDKVEVYTEGNSLIDYDSPRTISKIRIRLGNGAYRDSASDARGIAVLLPILRRIVLDVRIFLPQRDDCGIPDDRIPAITNFTRWTSGGMQESYDIEIRRRVRQILQESYRS